METKVITGKVRFSYANVFEPTSIGETGPKKYNVSILIDKNDTATINKINAAIEAAKVVGADKISKAGKILPNLKMPLRDGDEEKEDDSAYAGHFFVNANSSRKPQIVDKDLNEIISRDDFYSGCYGRASIVFYAYNVDGNKGIACGLNNIQKLEDGENLSGGSSATTDFADEMM
jgi:hypothetical protein